MALSYFLAQLLGLSLALFALAAFIRPQLVTEALAGFRQNTFVTIMAGFVGIMGGLAIVLSHNIWEPNWRGLVTLFGWAALFKGMTYIAAPDLLRSTANAMLGNQSKIKMTLLAAFLVGAYLAYKGFGQ